MTKKNIPENQTSTTTKNSSLNPQEQINLHATEEKSASQAFKETTGGDFASGEEYVAPQAQSFEESMQNMIAWIREKKAKASAHIPKAKELAGEPDGSSSLSHRAKNTNNPLSKEELEQSQQDIADGILGYIFKVDKDGKPLDLDSDVQQPYNPARLRKEESQDNDSAIKQSEGEAKKEAQPNQEEMLKWIKEMKDKFAQSKKESSSEEE